VQGILRYFVLRLVFGWQNPWRSIHPPVLTAIVAFISGNCRAVCFLPGNGRTVDRWSGVSRDLWRWMVAPPTIEQSGLMKHVFLTGASSGIGLAIAKLLVAQGHEVWGTSRNLERLPKVPQFPSGAPRPERSAFCREGIQRRTRGMLVISTC